MAKAHAQPIVMPLSNPTSATEITPEEAYTWTEGRAIVATGSPFDPVTLGGKTFHPSQCNNMYIFPGVGLGASVCAAETIPDSMLYQARRSASCDCGDYGCRLTACGNGRVGSDRNDALLSPSRHSLLARLPSCHSPSPTPLVPSRPRSLSPN